MAMQIKKLLGLKSEVPVVPTDQVIPLHWFEDGSMWKTVIVYTLLAFDEALDPETLRDSLTRLIQRDGYKKLGARIRKNVRFSPHFVALSWSDSFN